MRERSNFLVTRRYLPAEWLLNGNGPAPRKIIQRDDIHPRIIIFESPFPFRRPTGTGPCSLKLEYHRTPSSCGLTRSSLAQKENAVSAESRAEQFDSSKLPRNKKTILGICPGDFDSTLRLVEIIRSLFAV